MYKRLFYACTLAGALLANMSCTSTSDTSVSEINIIPLPSSITQESGSFLLKDGMTIGISDKSLMPAAEYLSSLLNRSTGYHLSIQEGEEGDIQLSLADSFSPKEGSYSLHIDKKKVTISSGNYGGFIAGIQTIRQLFPAEIESMTELPGNTWTLPAVTITDEPRFSWRGVMLDVSRHFYSSDEVKELLDLMALYKLNKFHWHLTDDQGWRIEIKKYPLLTEKGAWRPFNSQDRECMRRAQAEDNPDFEIPADNDSEIVFEYGTVSIDSKPSQKHTDNLFLAPPVSMTLDVRAHKNKVEFRQSNKSQDFIDSLRSVAENDRLRAGTALHKVFSSIATLDDISSVVGRLDAEGLGYGVSAEEITALLRRSFTDSRVRNWFSGGWTLFRECAIMFRDEDGNLVERRPDRVMVRGSEVIVVDFKFGRRMPAQHHGQVRQYKKLLAEMGYESVKGYLWYVYDNLVEEV